MNSQRTKFQLPDDCSGLVVSSHTLKPEDLAKNFLSFLESIDYPDTDAFRQQIEDEELLDDLFQLLDNIAPPNCYFGAHEGDGALFGFWPIKEDSL